MKIFGVTLLTLLTAGNMAAGDHDSVPATTAPHPHTSGAPFLNRLSRFWNEFSSIDTAYIEPQHYNFTVMLQNTNTYEVYHIRNQKGQEVVFAPRPAYKLGPYFGWRWIFLGYTLDVAHLKNRDGRTDFNVSLYSNMVGADLFYRKSGASYRITELTLGTGIDTSPMGNVPFAGFRSSIKGANLYYIFNHKKFSYPAAYSQSTVQRRSCGSAIAGIGYTRHKLDVDWKALENLVADRLGHHNQTAENTDRPMEGNVSYTDYSLSGGYAYNWVFAYNWLFDISVQGALAYKHSAADTKTEKTGIIRSFDFKNLNVDGILRMGVVWNNTKWFAGANTILHAYNYRKSRFASSNIFGSANLYVGFNFGKK